MYKCSYAQGPVEIAMVFLAPLADGKSAPTKHHNKLRISFKDFLKKYVSISCVLSNIVAVNTACSTF